jgi:hypothetical protein
MHQPQSEPPFWTASRIPQPVGSQSSFICLCLPFPAIICVPRWQETDCGNGLGLRASRLRCRMPVVGNSVSTRSPECLVGWVKSHDEHKSRLESGAIMPSLLPRISRPARFPGLCAGLTFVDWREDAGMCVEVFCACVMLRPCHFFSHFLCLRTCLPITDSRIGDIREGTAWG